MSWFGQTGMRRTFTGSLITLGAMFIITALMFAIGVGVGETSALYNVALSSVVFMLCLSPLVMLITAVSGIGLLVGKFNQRNTEKLKRDFLNDFGLDNDDTQMDAIMRRLTPQQQDYLKERLRNARLGVGEDGELMSMNELLDSFDSKEKRS